MMIGRNILFNFEWNYLNKMQTYQINDLERLTGLKAHTIRIWEKRYGLISPDRTTTNRRNYTDAQVRKLLNVTTLIAQGHKISKIAGYSEDEIFEYIKQQAERDQLDSVGAGYINDLIKCMLSLDEVGFEKIFSSAVLRYGLFDAMLKVVYPFLKKTGVLWCINKTAPVQEHFASSIVRRKLMAAIDGLMPPAISDPTFLLFLPPNEWHDVGLLFSNYILRSKGIKTIYLGQNVPHKDILEIVEEVNPQYLLFFYVAMRPAEEIKEEITALSKVSAATEVLVSVNAHMKAELETTEENITYIKDAYHLLELINANI